MGIFKKKEVPDELPGLAIDELEKKNSKKESRLYSRNESLPELKFPERKEKEEEEFVLNEVSHDVVERAEFVRKSPKTFDIENEQGYFTDLIKNVTSESKDVDKLDSWYQNKFLPGDIIFQMREYWEKQQPEILLKNISGELKTRLIEKTHVLHKLEKEWQESYFLLLAKEEQIRKEEKELKEMLSEFINIFKRNQEKGKKK